MKNKIHYTKPSITDLEVKYATDAAANGWGEHCYDYIERFESLFMEHLGVKHSIATSSCTGALHMGMAALGIGPGDEVILADTNWIATAASIVHLGAKPVFVDILADSWCIDPELAEGAISKNTKAIVATHLYGNLCKMEQLLAIGEKYNLPIIEDTAEAIGSVYHGNRAGSMGKFGAFSFHGTKTITTGEGGIFVTNDSELYENVLTLSNHGRDRFQKKQFWADVVGFKYKMSNIQAAIGCGQLERIDELIKRKREILSFYKHSLQDFTEVSMNPEPNGCINGAWMPTIVFNESVTLDRTLLLNELKKEKIDARVFFWPLSALPMFRNSPINANAYRIHKKALNLPSFFDLTSDEMERVMNVIKQFLRDG